MSLSTKYGEPGSPNEADEVATVRQEFRDFIEPEKSIIDSHEESQIASFYENRSIFITGASGFVGKVSGMKQISKLKLRILKSHGSNQQPNSIVCAGEAATILPSGSQSFYFDATKARGWCN